MIVFNSVQCSLILELLECFKFHWVTIVEKSGAFA